MSQQKLSLIQLSKASYNSTALIILCFVCILIFANYKSSIPLDRRLKHYESNVLANETNKVSLSQNIDYADHKSEPKKNGKLVIVLDTVAETTKTHSKSINKSALNSLLKDARSVEELPALESGMVNVTYEEICYRLQKTDKESKVIAIRFSESKIPAGYTLNDVHTYRFDKLSNRWLVLKRDSIDLSKNIVYSTTADDGDFINAIIKLPDAPETQGYIPTTMSDLKVGDPASMMQIIEPPTPNNQGTSNLSYHIELPKGRQGVEPNLNITYNSDGGNGYLGEGWSLSGISAITVDTRRGVPKYDLNIETETYLLDGQMLAFKHKEPGKTPAYFPGISRASVNESDTTSFQMRKESSFELIERIGKDPENYSWVVTAKNGTRYYYGRDENGFNENSMIRKTAGKSKGIAEWKIIKVIDVFGNYMSYAYEKDNKAGYLYAYPSKVKYTQHQQSTSIYQVEFVYDKKDRVDDIAINGRQGVVVNPKSRLLSSIVISRFLNPAAGAEAVRKYNLEYKTGAFEKTLLSKLIQFGHDGTEFNHHQFSYYDEKGPENFYTQVTATVNDKGLVAGDIRDPLRITNKFSTAIGSSTSSTNTTGMYIGIGVGSPASVNFSGGIQYNNTSSNSKGLNTLIDIDGDGLPDKIFVNNGQLQFEKNVSSGNEVKFNAEPIRIAGATNQFMEEKSRTTGWGARANYGASAGYDYNRTEGVVNTYFSDVNGDGLIDIIKGADVFFNTGKISGGMLQFSQLSSGTPNPINGSGNVSTTFVYDNSSDKELIDNNPLIEVVRLWEAPFDGKIQINGQVKLLPPTEDTDETDGVWVSVQSKRRDTTIQLTKSDLKTHTIKLSNVDVKKGEKVFFRVQSGRDDNSNGAYDKVEWNPEIKYTQSSVRGVDTLVANPAIQRYVYSASKDFLLSNQLPITLPDGISAISLQGKFKKDITMDNVSVQLVQLVKDPSKPILDLNGNPVKDDSGKAQFEYVFDTILFKKDFTSVETASDIAIPSSIGIKENDRKLQLLIRSDVNIDLSKVNWEPEIVYKTKIKLSTYVNDSTLVAGKDSTVTEKIFAVPFYVFNDTLRSAAVNYDLIKADTTLSFYPNLTLLDQNVNASFWFAVKTPKKVLGKKLLTYKNGRLTDTNPLMIPLTKDDPFIATIESQDSDIGKLNTAAYTSSCNTVLSTDYYFPGDKFNASFVKLPITAPHSPASAVTIKKEGSYKIIPEFFVRDDSVRAKVNIQVWKNNSRVDLGKQDSVISIEKGKIIFPLNYISLSFKSGDKVAVQFTSSADTLIKNPTLIKKFSVSQSFSAEFWTRRQNETFGPLHHGWGQFLYSGMGGRAKKAIDTNLLILPKGSRINSADFDVFKNNVNTAAVSHQPIAKDQKFDDLSAVNAIFAPMLPVANDKIRCWMAGEESIFLTGQLMGTSRLGIDNVKSINPFTAISTTVGGTDNSYGRGISKVSISTSKTYSGGYGMLGANHTDGDTKQVSDFMDMNGDKFPDILNESSMQITNVNGTLGEVYGNSLIHNGTNNSNGLSVNGTSGGSKPESGGVPAKSKAANAPALNNQSAAATNQQAGFNIGGSGALNNGVDNVQVSWVDMNGDGLPDKFYQTGYELNLGYNEYAPRVTFPELNINKANNLSLSPGLTAGFSIDLHSFSGGAGLSFSASKSLNMLQDINGDGLPDKIEVTDDGDLFVEVNTGKGFLAKQKWTNIAKGAGSSGTLANVVSLPIGLIPNNPVTGSWLKMERTKFNASNSVSAGGSASFGFMIPFTPIKVVFNPSYNHAEGLGRSIRQIIDMNGDGYPDIVYSTRESNMEVLLSSLGKSNKLRTVENPIGGSFTLNYDHQDISAENPGGKWVMRDLEINDGIKADRTNPAQDFDGKKTFMYTGGKYDRYEREFLGFAKVITRDLDFSNKPYRSIVRTYDTSSYYAAGNLLEELVTDGTDISKKYTLTRNKYYEEKLKSVSYTIGGFKRELGIVFSPVLQTVNMTYEGTGTPFLQNKSHYYYNNSFGYATKFQYKENPSSENSDSYDYETIISYVPNDISNYIIGLPKDVETKDNKGKTLRRIGADYYKWEKEFDNSGTIIIGQHKRLKSVSNYLDGGKKATTELRYDNDAYGNIKRKKLPNGLIFDYAYDTDPAISKTNTYITEVKSIERGAVSSETKYDYRYGVPIQTRDINDNYVNYKLDAFGRIVRIIGPRECQNPKNGECDNSKYTIKIEYAVKGGNNPVKMPVTSTVDHYDAAYPSGIKTINFVDGFNRSVQIKKTAAIANSDGTLNNDTKWISSGRINYDPFGRAVERYYPDKDNDGAGLTFIERVNPNKYVTTGTYDILDRPLTNSLPDKGLPGGKLIDSTFYSKDANYSLATTIFFNDKNGGNQKKVTYTNGSGITGKETSFDNAGTSFTTTFKYDPIHQLEQVIDSRNAITNYAYDPSGNKTGIVHSDAGKSQFIYDGAGRLSSKITAKGDTITYKYNLDRLIQILYKKHPENNVLYVYSDDKEIGNSVNRIVYLEDASGAQAFEYGKLGEIRKTTRTVIAPFSSVLHTFVTRYDYDTWNRIKSIIYPDQEEVVYKYNRAGLLESVTGNRDKGLNPPPSKMKTVAYVSKIGYDEFEQRVIIKYGNETETKYTYEPERRRLNGINVSGIKADAIDFFSSFNSSYDYDNQNNIISTKILKSKPGASPSSMDHFYIYDRLNRLDSASGNWKSGTEVSSYRLGLNYDGVFNIINKNLALEAKKIATATPEKISYLQNYFYDNSANHQLTRLEETIRQNDDTEYAENNKDLYTYDKNGNNVLKTTGDKSGKDKVFERKIVWDEENRINAISTNGFVSHYVYDASGERTIKLSAEQEGVYVNGRFAGDTSISATYSVYANPYYSMRNGNEVYTKHIYIGSQRILSQVGNSKSYDRQDNFPANVSPPICPAGNLCTNSVSYADRRNAVNKRINTDYDQLDLPHELIKDNAFNKPPAEKYQLSINPLVATTGKEPLPGKQVPELLCYYYHGNQIGSTSFITDDNSKVVQYLEYMPFGETFMEQRKNYSGQFLFNGKEQDQETGLYYYGARYYDPHTYQWLGVDPKADQYPAVSPYNFNLGNPVKMVDKDGKESEDVLNKAISTDNLFLTAYGHYRVGEGKELVVNTQSLNFSGLSQENIKTDKNGNLSIQTFDGGINSTSAAIGKVGLIAEGDNKYSLKPDKYDFNIESRNLFSGRNFLTVIGGLLHNLPERGDEYMPNMSIRPQSFMIRFEGKIELPKTNNK